MKPGKRYKREVENGKKEETEVMNGGRAGGDGFVRKLKEVLGSFVRSIQK